MLSIFRSDSCRSRSNLCLIDRRCAWRIVLFNASDGLYQARHSAGDYRRRQLVWHSNCLQLSSVFQIVFSNCLRADSSVQTVLVRTVLFKDTLEDLRRLLSASALLPVLRNNLVIKRQIFILDFACHWSLPRSAVRSDRQRRAWRLVSAGNVYCCFWPADAAL